MQYIYTQYIYTQYIYTQYIYTPLQYMFYAVHSYIVNYVAPNYLQGVSMQACKTHLVGTQKRKTHIIAGVLTILGVFQGYMEVVVAGGKKR